MPAFKPHKPLLGEAEQVPLKRTPLGVAYDSRGFDRPRAKKIAKAIEYMRRHNIPAGVVSEFEAYAHLIGRPEHIPEAIDKAFDEVRGLWTSCGPDSKAAGVARSIDPRSITVIVEPVTFWLPNPGLYANGCALLDGRTIRAACCAVLGFTTLEDVQLATFDNLILWEIGNLFAMRAGYKIKGVGDEIGNNSPCGKIH